MNYKYLQALKLLCASIEQKDISIITQAAFNISELVNDCPISRFEAKVAGLFRKRIEKYLEKKGKNLIFNDDFIIFRGKQYKLEKFLINLLKLLYEKRILSFSDIEKELGIQEESIARYISLLRREIKGLPIHTLYGYGYEYIG